MGQTKEQGQASKVQKVRIGYVWCGHSIQLYL